MVIETIFTDGTSRVQTYSHATPEEAMQHAWSVGRLTGKEIQTVHRLFSLQAARAIARGGMVPHYDR